MAVDFKWTTYSEKITPEDGIFPYLLSKGQDAVNRPIEFTQCLNAEGFTDLTVFTSDMAYVDMGYEQFQILQSCTPDGTLINAFMHSDAVTTYAELCNYLGSFLPF